MKTFLCQRKLSIEENHLYDRRNFVFAGQNEMLGKRKSISKGQSLMWDCPHFSIYMNRAVWSIKAIIILEKTFMKGKFGGKFLIAQDLDLK